MKQVELQQFGTKFFKKRERERKFGTEVYNKMHCNRIIPWLVKENTEHGNTMPKPPIVLWRRTNGKKRMLHASHSSSMP
jgi:hypothetical protein